MSHMTTRIAVSISLVGGIGLLAGCGDDEPGDATGATDRQTTVVGEGAPATEPPAVPDSILDTTPEPDEGSNPGVDGPAGSGEATLTIGAETWTFEGFVCAFGYDNTQSEVFSFSSNAFGTLDDGTRTQLQANIWDDTGSNSLTGPGTDHEVTFDDIENFDDPQVNWVLSGPELTFDDLEISVEGTFRDLETGAEAEGSLVAECGPGSRL